MEKEVFTLKQVVGSLKKTIESRYSRLYWVKAEIYKLNVFPSGHAFPELVQREQERIVANMSGTIWKTQLDRIKRDFEATVKEPFSEGKEVLMLVKVAFHELYGLSLQIQDIDSNYSLGALHRLKMETIEKLNQLGLLQRNQLLKLSLPKRIAVISAASSKGLSDFMQVLEESKGRYGISTFLFNTAVQGDQAIPSVLSSLSKIEHLKHFFDAVVIVRGGGAEVGMSCYDDFSICKRIAEFPLPVLCGIGHSTNLTVSEMVAHAHAITPSVLASDIIKVFDDKATSLRISSEKMMRQVQWINQKNHSQLEQTLINFNSLSRWCFEKSNMDLTSRQMALISLSKHAFKTEKINQQWSVRKLLDKVKTGQSESDHLHNMAEQKIKLLFQTYLSRTNQSLLFAEKQVYNMSPDVVLARGFAIARLKGRAILNSEILKQGDLLDIEFKDGTAKALIQ